MSLIDKKKSILLLIRSTKDESERMKLLKSHVFRTGDLEKASFSTTGLRSEITIDSYLQSVTEVSSLSSIKK